MPTVLCFLLSVVGLAPESIASQSSPPHHTQFVRFDGEVLLWGADTRVPLAGVTITLELSGIGDGQFVQIAETTTGVDGRFTFRRTYVGGDYRLH